MEVAILLNNKFKQTVPEVERCHDEQPEKLILEGALVVGPAR